MKKMIQKWMLIAQVTLLVILSGMSMASSAALVGLSDQELGSQTGQSLLNLSYLAPSDMTNPMKDSSIGFYTLGVEGTLALNANIKNLQLGCGGVNGAGGCDIDAQNVSFGCVANATGNCITQAGGTVGGEIATQMKDFVLNNPFLQIAIKDPNKASTRQVLGFRLGAGQVTGPLSFGTLNSFSGYLSAKANLTALGGTDVATTCKYPGNCVAPGANTSRMNHNGASSYGAPSVSCGFLCNRGGETAAAGGYLGLGDDMILDIGLAHIRFQEATVDYQTVSRTNLPVSVSGNRQTQALIQNVALGGVVNSIVYGSTDGSTNVGANPLTLNRTDAGVLVGALGPTLLPLLRGGVADQIKRQLAQGLQIYDLNSPSNNQTIINGKSDAQVNTDLNNFQIPYNVSNVHQIDVNSNLFGLSVQSQAIQYPGYAQAVSQGWAFYLPNAFTLNIAQPTTTLVSNITGSTAARDGNIVQLPSVYQNCYGSLKFC